MDSNGWFTQFISNLLDPSMVYEHLTYGAGLMAFLPWLLVIFMTIRILQESSAGMTGKAALAEAASDLSQGLLYTLGWATGGLAVFTLLWAFSELFGRFGSAQLIHNEMLDLREILMADDEAKKTFWQNVVEHVMDWGNIFSGALGFVIYNIISAFYAVIVSLIHVLFAVGLALTYAWGFVAIPTKSMKPPFNLTEGLVKTLLTFFIWVILEPVLLGFVYILGQGGSEFLATNYQGFGDGVAAIGLWYAYAAAMMSLVLIIKIITPFMALKLASNQSMVGPLAMGPAALGAMVANQVVKTVASSQRGVAGHMAPNSEGSRSRDRAAQAVGDVMRTPVGQLMPGGGSSGGGSAGSGGNDITSGPAPGAAPDPTGSAGSVTGPTGGTTDSGAEGVVSTDSNASAGDTPSDSTASPRSQPDPSGGQRGTQGPSGNASADSAGAAPESAAEDPQDLTSMPPSEPSESGSSGTRSDDSSGGRS